MDTASHQSASDASSFCSLSSEVVADVAQEMHDYYDSELSGHGRGGWRWLGKRLGFSGAYVREVALGKKKPSVELTERWLVLTFRLEYTYRVSACPDCGGVHTGRCHGKRGEFVIRPERPQSPAWLREVAAWLQQRENGHVPQVPRCYTRQGKAYRHSFTR